LVELTILCQSRGSMPAVALAGVAFLLVSRNRLRTAICIALAAVPAALAAPVLLDVYGHGHADPAVVPLLRDAARAIAATCLASLLLAAVCFGAVEPRLRVGERTSAAIGRVAAIGTILVAVVFAAGFVARHGGPIEFADQRVREFNTVGYPDLRSQGIRYGANIGSNRRDFWRAAADEGSARPLAGGGAGSFEVAYLRRRDPRSDDSPEDPHSLEALMFSELGFPGLALACVFLTCCALAALRSRKLGPAAATVAAGAIGAGAQWLTQASYDWIWNYPGVTAPVMFLLGAAAAPALLDPGAAPRRALRRGGAALLVLLALLAVPLTFSARYLQRAYGETADSPRQAAADLDRAADLNPLDADPLLVKASVELRLGEREAALADLRATLEREPDNFEANLLLARLLAETDPAAAREALREARELNPHSPELDEVEAAGLSEG
jgi:hypothetical protein